MSDAISKGVDLYIVHTPSHILFALNMVRLNASGDRSLLLVIEDFPNAIGPIKMLKEGAFSAVEFAVVPGYAGLDLRKGASAWNSTLLRRFRQLTASLCAIRIARQLLRGRMVRRVYVFNDTRHEVQAIMGILHERGVEEFTYLDEGLASYRKTPLPKRPSVLRLLYGRGWLPLREYGVHPLIEKAYLLFPPYAHGNLQAKPIEPMPRFSLKAEDLRTLESAFDPDGSLDRLPSRVEESVLIFLPHSSLVFSAEGLSDWVKRMSQRCAATGSHLILKYHPREPETDYLDVQALPGSSLVDRTVPGELLALRVQQDSREMVAEASSILLTLRWLYPTRKITAVQAGTVLGEEEFRSIFEALDIEFLRLRPSK